MVGQLGLAGSVVVVTGASGDLGQVIVDGFLDAGACVSGLDIQPGPARYECGNPEYMACSADLTNEEQVARTFEQIVSRWGRVDVLVNAAGGSHSPDILDTTASLWREELERNLTTAFLCSKAALTTMVLRRFGVVVNLSSANAVTGVGEAAYSAAKAGLIALTYNIAVRYGRGGIRANSLCLGVIDAGPVWRDAKARQPGIMADLAREIPTGRVGTPAEVASLVLFLASDQSRLINGANIMADGGWSIGVGMTDL